MARIRPFRSDDIDGLYDVCVKTADVGADATGMLEDDALWGDLFAVPYARRDPGLCWVVESDDGRVIGYVVATDDTDAFAAWFQDEWWPSRQDRYRRSGASEPTAQDRFIAYGDRQAPGDDPIVREYPAHLHIDLLPETQGQGLGRRLIDTLLAELARRGVPALHLSMNAANAPAGAFYERLGFTQLASGDGSTTYGITIPAASLR
ncbi:Mycothiol acetyltransferase [Microbacterium azadirachtae]|uniref:Mycothiol acetyltransferase n=1 Tax=Microbacterium azadirachtae TaxID=582680 RepID=A0A0F0KSQ8_9MICO|nr:GNAT family N-acetyltransferase [Microbacterium azadirachtae]KJL23903.1 Mycothiol acetyltransferase [Microbacterium azadirachtae]